MDAENFRVAIVVVSFTIAMVLALGLVVLVGHVYFDKEDANKKIKELEKEIVDLKYKVNFYCSSVSYRSFEDAWRFRHKK